MMHNVLTRLLIVAGLLGLIGCSKPATAPNASASSTSTGSNATSTERAATSTVDNSGSAPEAPVPPLPAPESKPIIVHAGSTFMVTVDQSVSSKTSNPGDHFDASLAAPVRVDGVEVIPSGARVTGVVTEAKSAGKFKGNAEISVALDSVRVNGESYRLKTTSITEAGKGRGKRTAVGAGGGAVLGGIIGAIAGGGKGAAIGAGAGAGAGTAGAAFTGERDITIDAETRLRFKLKEPLKIQGK